MTRDVQRGVGYNTRMLLPLLIAALLAPPPPEVGRIGVPGVVAAWGEAEPVAADGADVVAARSGGVVLFGHGGYLQGGPLLDWAKEAVGPDVRVMNAADVTADELPGLRRHLDAGGGLVLGITGWGWEQITGGDVADLPAQELLWPLGLAITDRLTTGAGPLTTTGLPAELNATKALAALEDGTAADPASASRVVINAEPFVPDRPDPLGPVQRVALRAELDALAESDLTPAIHGLGRDPNSAHEHALARVALAAWLRLAETGRIHVPPAHPVAHFFPGDVGPDAISDSVRVTVDLSRPGWHSTGMYAMPRNGLVVEAHGEAPPGLKVRIGAHSDELWHKAEWHRPPRVTVEHPIDAAYHGSVFGGPVYVVVPPGLEGTLDVAVGGSAVKMPYFKLGETDPAAWRETIRHHDAPWAELACDALTITLPSSAVRDLDDPRPVLEHWQNVQEVNAKLAGRPVRRDRIVNDRQISAGYMHAGHPIMTGLDVAEKQLDLGWLRSTAAWGFYHELGHNHQRPAWTWDGLGEVTCNLFTLYALEAACGLTPEEAAGRVLTGGVREKIEQHLDDPNARPWTVDPFVALGLFVELRLAFGWGPIERAFADYPPDPGTTAARTRLFVETMSRETGRDLRPFFARWGVPHLDEAEVADLPSWAGKDGLWTPAESTTSR